MKYIFSWIIILNNVKFNESYFNSVVNNRSKEWYMYITRNLLIIHDRYSLLLILFVVLKRNAPKKITYICFNFYEMINRDIFP